MEVEWLEGRISVEAAIVAKRRSIETVYIHKKKREHQFGSLLQLTESADIPVKFANDAFFTDHARGKSHGGVLALVGSRKYSEPKDLLEANGIPLIVMLDGVEDPFNFGQAVRALYAAGVSGLVVVYMTACLGRHHGKEKDRCMLGSRNGPWEHGW